MKYLLFILFLLTSCTTVHEGVQHEFQYEFQQDLIESIQDGFGKDAPLPDWLKTY